MKISLFFLFAAFGTTATAFDFFGERELQSLTCRSDTVACPFDDNKPVEASVGSPFFNALNCYDSGAPCLATAGQWVSLNCGLNGEFSKCSFMCVDNNGMPCIGSAGQWVEINVLDPVECDLNECPYDNLCTAGAAGFTPSRCWPSTSETPAPAPDATPSPSPSAAPPVTFLPAFVLLAAVSAIIVMITTNTGELISS